MQVPAPCEYERATSVEHAVELLDRLGSQATLLAGGHSLIPMMKLRLANPGCLIDINPLHDELGHIAVEPAGVRIGAMVRHRELLESAELAALWPIFRDAERVIADPLVRNRGTIGGSLCQADPAEDLTTVCRVLDATCVLRGPGGVRTVGIDEFHVGPYETAAADNEILTEIRIPFRDHGSNAYAKVERRVGDWAIVAAGCALWLDGAVVAEARIGLTAVNADPAGLGQAREFLVGRTCTEDVARQTGELVAGHCDPVSDMRGSAEYKRHLAAELTRRTLLTAAARVH
ncbi:xanthine dehydrogenase family protein subunit M [Rhodococcus olei]|uniref:Xanthine dehydrogenase family protein subunit M n=1 Tax=Rhodococcus olei TaxID=2161675 RepID=A0ABP8P141_9NOCA